MVSASLGRKMHAFYIVSASLGGRMHAFCMVSASLGGRMRARRHWTSRRAGDVVRIKIGAILQDADNPPARTYILDYQGLGEFLVTRQRYKVRVMVGPDKNTILKASGRPDNVIGWERVSHRHRHRDCAWVHPLVIKGSRRLELQPRLGAWHDTKMLPKRGFGRRPDSGNLYICFRNGNTNG